jgi:hypothetical protein
MNVYFDSCGYSHANGCVGVVCVEDEKILALGAFYLSKLGAGENIELRGLKKVAYLIRDLNWPLPKILFNDNSVVCKTYCGYELNCVTRFYCENICDIFPERAQNYVGMWLADKVGRYAFYKHTFPFSEKLNIRCNDAPALIDVVKALAEYQQIKVLDRWRNQ